MTDRKAKLLRYASIGAFIVGLHAAEYQGKYEMFGGGSSGTTTSNTVSNPWSGQQPYLSQTYQQAQNLYQNPSDYPQLYPGATSGSEVAQLNPIQTSAISEAGNLSEGNNALDTAGNALSYYNNGNMLSAENPYFQNMAQTVAAQVQPQLTSSFNAGNNMNNPGAAFAVSQGLNNAIGNLAYQNYNQQSQNQLTAAQDSTGNNLGELMSNQNALSAGTTAQNTAQNTINSQVAGYNYNQTLPYQMLDQYASLIAGSPGGSTSTTSPYFNNTASNLLSAGTSLGSAALLAYLL